MAIGAGLWTVAFVILFPLQSRLAQAGHGGWVWTCLAGAGLGLMGVYYCRHHQDVEHQDAETQGIDPSPEQESLSAENSPLEALPVYRTAPIDHTASWDEPAPADGLFADDNLLADDPTIEPLLVLHGSPWDDPIPDNDFPRYESSPNSALPQYHSASEQPTSIEPQTDYVTLPGSETGYDYTSPDYQFEEPLASELPWETFAQHLSAPFPFPIAEPLPLDFSNGAFSADYFSSAQLAESATPTSVEDAPAGWAYLPYEQWD